MSLRALKIVAHWATRSAHAEDDDCFHCIALEALKEITALERAAEEFCGPIGEPPLGASDFVRLMCTIAKEAK